MSKPTKRKAKELYYAFVALNKSKLGAKHSTILCCKEIIEYIDRMNGTEIFKREGIILTKYQWEEVIKEIEAMK